MVVAGRWQWPEVVREVWKEERRWRGERERRRRRRRRVVDGR